MRRRVVFAVAALSLALASRGDAAVHLVGPIDGALVTASAVAVTLTLDDPSDVAALVVRANGDDITNRLRGDGLSRTLLLAGVPGHDNVLRLGRNRLTIVAPGGGESTFSWRPPLERVHLVVVGNRIDFAAYSSMVTWRAEVERIFDQLVRPQFVPGRPNVVLLTEDFGLPAALVGTRGATTRAAKDQVAALTNLFVAYAPQASFYTSA